MRCSSYCTADSYSVDDLARYLRMVGYEPKFYDDVIHIQKERDEDGSFADVFFFPYGCIVVWGLEDDESGFVFNLVEEFQDNKLDTPITDICFYHLNPNQEPTRLNEEEDEFHLESDDVLVKLSFSHALSQSVKLTGFEIAIAQTIANTRHLPHELATQGKTSLSSEELSKKIGLLFAQRNSMNLHSDILDTPEFFWRRPRYESYYQMGSEYMDLQARVGILNRKLDVIHELYEILSNELKHLHSSRLEVVVILLIMIEVMFNILRDYELILTPAKKILAMFT